jgi:hypothetical protein
VIRFTIRMTLEPDTLTFPSISLKDGTQVDAVAHHTPLGWAITAVRCDPEIANRADVMCVIPKELRGTGTSYEGRFAAGMGLLVNALGYVRGVTGDDCDASNPVPAR